MLEKLKASLQKQLAAYEDRKEDRWYVSYQAMEDFDIVGKLVADRDVEVISSANYHSVPILVDGRVRRRYLRYYPQNPLEKEIEKLIEEGHLSEGEAWRYKPRLLTKMLFIPVKINKGSDRIVLSKPLLISFWGVRAHKSLLRSLSALIETGESEKFLNPETFFDPFSEDSQRVKLFYTPGKDGTLILQAIPVSYRPPADLPEELRDFSLKEIGLPTEDDWEPNLEDYKEAVEGFRAFVMEGSHSRSKSSAPSGGKDESPPWREEESTVQVSPSGTKVISKGEFVYELRSDGKPTCFGKVDTSDPRCLSCDFLAECIAQ